jgi:hypothetical protein
MPSTSIVDTGPYRFTRNPIYLGMMLGLVGLAIAFDNLWLLVTIVPFFLVIRYGVVAREEPISSASSAKSIAATAHACGAGYNQLSTSQTASIPHRSSVRESIPHPSKRQS